MISKKTQTIIKNIIVSVGCNKCILFGSHARGDNTLYSDYDLLVIIEKRLSVQEKIKLASHLRGKFAEKNIDADIIVKSPDEIEYYKNKTGHIVKHAVAEGIPVW
ncbi:MAG: nucleotidyltransferase domain-containing protein [Chitinispirillia bacterium]|jgi:predicted nucleotidyltransferase